MGWMPSPASRGRRQRRAIGSPLPTPATAPPPAAVLVGVLVGAAWALIAALAPSNTALAAGNPPENTEPPSISGAPVESGMLTALEPATVATQTDPISVAVSPYDSGMPESVYVANYASKTISEFSRNTETGKLTALSTATVEVGTDPRSLAVSPDGG